MKSEYEIIKAGIDDTEGSLKKNKFRFIDISVFWRWVFSMRLTSLNLLALIFLLSIVSGPAWGQVLPGFLEGHITDVDITNRTARINGVLMHIPVGTADCGSQCAGCGTRRRSTHLSVGRSIARPDYAGFHGRHLPLCD